MLQKLTSTICDYVINRLLGFDKNERECKLTLQRCTQTLAKQPDNMECLDERGKALLALGEYGEALRDFERLLELKQRQGHDQFYTNDVIADALLGLGRYEEALKIIDILIAIQPGAVHLYSRRSDCNVGLGRIEEAIRDLTVRLEKSPSAIYYHSRGELYTQLGQHHLAAPDFAKYEELRKVEHEELMEYQKQRKNA